VSHALLFTAAYKRRSAVFLKRHPPCRSAYLDTLHLLQQNPYHPALCLRAMSGRLGGLHQVFLLHSRNTTLAMILRPGQIMPVHLQQADPPA
jgi:hypothetical protein